MQDIKLKDGSGAEHTYAGIDTVTIPLSSGSGTAVFVDATSDTATANDILSSKTAHTSAGLVTGNITTYDGATSITPSTSAQTFSTSGKYVGSNLTVAAIPNQQSASGNTTLNMSTTSKSFPAGYYANAHGCVQGLSYFDW